MADGLVRNALDLPAIVKGLARQRAFWRSLGYSVIESPHSEMLVSIHDVQTYGQTSAEDCVRQSALPPIGSAVCARQRHGAGRREAELEPSTRRWSSFRNVGTFGSDHQKGQRGKVERGMQRLRTKVGACTAKRSMLPSSMSLMGNTPAPQRRRDPHKCLVRRRFHAAGGRASRQLPG